MQGGVHLGRDGKARPGPLAGDNNFLVKATQEESGWSRYTTIRQGRPSSWEQNQRQLHRTEAEARVAGIQMLLGWNEDGVLNGSAERRHYAHGDTNACGTPLEDGRAGRNEPISCLDCLGALGLLGS